jgi:hypothetical protein
MVSYDFWLTLFLKEKARRVMEDVVKSRVEREIPIQLGLHIFPYVLYAILLIVVALIFIHHS